MSTQTYTCYDNWQTIPNTTYQFQKSNPISESISSKIYVVKNNNSSTLPYRALKLYESGNGPSPHLYKLLNKEIKNVVAFYDLKQTNPSFLVMQLCRKNLRTILNQQRQCISSQNILRKASEIVQGLLSLKKQNIIHCDIKPQNLVLSKSGIVKICDLDFILSETEANQKKYRIGTLQYMAPEILREGKCSYQSDVWSLGIVCYELAFLKHPFPSFLGKKELNQKIFMDCYQQIKKNLGNIQQSIIKQIQSTNDTNTVTLMELIMSCLTLQRQNRADLQDLNMLLVNQKPNRKGSWFSQTTVTSESESQLVNQKLMTMIFQLQTNLNLLPKSSLQFKKNKELFAVVQSIISKSKSKDLNQKQKRQLKKRLISQVKMSKNRIQRNVERLQTKQQRQLFGKDKLLTTLIQLNEMMRSSEDENDMNWINGHITKSAQFLH